MPSLDGGHRARGEAAVAAAAADGLAQAAVDARGADPVVVEEAIRRAGEFVVVDGHHHGDARPAARGDHRRRELVIDVVEVDDIGPEPREYRSHPPGRGRRPHHPAGETGSRAEAGRGRVELGIRREVALEGQPGVVGMGHPEERDLVPPGTLEVRQVEEMGLGPSPAVQEFADVEDAHTQPSAGPVAAPSRRRRRR